MNLLSPDQIAALLTPPGAGPVYLVGAGGCGMSGLGHLLLDLGCAVRGSDLVLSEEVQQLRARGAEIHIGHDPAILVGARPALVVYSSAIRSGNPELQAAARLNIPLARRAVLLSALQRRQRGICVAGMHGKTTTTALLAWALQKLEADPSYAIGALAPQIGRHARFAGVTLRAPGSTPAVDSGRWFVAETDESDGTLREFSPEHSIILNVDEEHLDYYANLEAVCREFTEFGSQTRGLVVFCADDERLGAMFASRPRSISYGFNPLATYRAVSCGDSGAAGASGSRFAVWRGPERLGEFEIGLLGEKNLLNATAVIALLSELGYAQGEIARAILGFHGAARRQEEIFHNRGVRVFDDYGHHPREIEATLSALRALGGRRLLVAFQPHRFTRTLHLAGEFSRCFRAADKLWLTEVYAASEPAIPGVDGEMLAKAVRAQGQAVEYVPNLSDLNPSIREALEPGDIML